MIVVVYFTSNKVDLNKKINTTPTVMLVNHSRPTCAIFTTSLERAAESFSCRIPGDLFTREESHAKKEEKRVQ